MAENDNDDVAAASKKGPGWLLWGGAALLVVAVAVGATLWFLTRGDAAPATEEAEAATPEQANGKAPALYFPLKPAIVVNFESRGRVRFLQASVTVMARDPFIIDGVQEHLPLIRNRLVLMFGGEIYEELQTDEGRELLRQKAREAIDEILRQEIGKTGIEQVLFTSFVMQ